MKSVRNPYLVQSVMVTSFRGVSQEDLGAQLAQHLVGRSTNFCSPILGELRPRFGAELIRNFAEKGEVEGTAYRHGSRILACAGILYCDKDVIVQEGAW